MVGKEDLKMRQNHLKMRQIKFTIDNQHFIYIFAPVLY